MPQSRGPKSSRICWPEVASRIVGKSSDSALTLGGGPAYSSRPLSCAHGGLANGGRSAIDHAPRLP